MLYIATKEGETLPFDVVGILEEADSAASYAVLHRESGDAGDEFIVTNLNGELLENERLAREIVDEFLASAEEEQ
ncbi:MAG: hypothetical protein JO104_08475 [Candidatus Eremiobacteraeota bacterium]|nr:hypothetical protein [Candidatus Eremiobacteraeota bacterium]